MVVKRSINLLPPLQISVPRILYRHTAGWLIAIAAIYLKVPPQGSSTSITICISIIILRVRRIPTYRVCDRWVTF